MTLKQKLDARCKELGLNLVTSFTGSQYSIEIYKDGYEIDGSPAITFYSNNVDGARNDLRQAMLEQLMPENHCEITRIA